MRPGQGRQWRLCWGLAACAVLCLLRGRRGGHLQLVGSAGGGDPRARAVITDVDGTLMNSSHRLPAPNRLALRSCMQRGLPVVLATGKHCGPWVPALLEDVVGGDLEAASPWTLNAPGVFVQGLLVRNAAGEVVSTRALDRAVVDACLEAGEAFGWTVLAYTDDSRVVSNRADPEAHRVEVLGEPKVEVGPVQTAVLKLVIIARPEDEIAVRRELGRVVAQDAAITVAIPGLVEVLPPGASKADGVRVALELLGLQPSDALALGDGENDLELLQLVREGGGMAVAMGNARPVVKQAANAVVATADEAGWADAVHRWALP